MNISVSEINSYLTCRRAWDLSSANRKSLKHKVTPKMFFVVGNAVHEAIDAQASGDDPHEFFEEYVSRERADRRAAYEEAVGSIPWQSEMEEFEASVNLARNLVDQYFLQYGSENPLEDLGLKYVATEVPFSIPLDAFESNFFVGTFDGIATDLATETKFWLVENKTYDRRPNMADFWRGNQPVGYSWAFRALTGQTPAGMVYNGIAKHLIESPKVLQSGELSTNKQAKVTVKSYLKAIQEGGRDPVKYLPFLEFLEERERNGDDRFFYREIQAYSNLQLDNWERAVLHPVSNEIKDYQYPDTPFMVYPNYTSCRGCLVKDLCTAIDMDEDFDAVVNARYEVKTYGTMEAVNGVTPTRVANAHELIELLKEGKNVSR